MISLCLLIMMRLIQLGKPERDLVVDVTFVRNTTLLVNVYFVSCFKSISDTMKLVFTTDGPLYHPALPNMNISASPPSAEISLSGDR